MFVCIMELNNYGFDENDNPVLVEQKHSFKLINGARGYRWEIKVFEKDIEKLIEMVDKIDQEARLKWQTE